MCPHTVLKIPCEASIDEAKRAYRALAKKYHPDLNKGSDAEKSFLAITEAVEVIKDGRSNCQPIVFVHGVDIRGSTTYGGIRFTWTQYPN